MMNNRDNFRIIIIDDNPAIHHDFLKILKTEVATDLDALGAELFGETLESKNLLPQFNIDVASQGHEGLDYIKKSVADGNPYALAFVDIRMPPGWDGIETIKQIWEIDKDIQVVICTAYSDYSWEETVAHLGRTDNLLILKKPFDNISVRQLACALTTKWKLTEESHKSMVDLTQQVADRTASLQTSLSLVKSTFESSSDGILVVNGEGSIIDYNQKFLDIFKIPLSIMEEKKEDTLINYMKDKLENKNGLFYKFREFRDNPDEISIDVVRLADGDIFECYSQPHKLNEKIIGRILAFRDITKRARLEQELLHQATHDSLTGLANRVMLLEKIKLALKNSENNRAKFAVVFLDFDRFKLINDSLSHMVGDKILQEAADRLKTEVRAEDTLARLGGDEFVIVFMNFDKKEHIALKMQKLIDLFRLPFIVGDRQITLTASMGICLYPQDGETADILLRNADAAMYRAKSLKGDTFEFYSPEMSVQSLEELDQEMELRQAIVNGDLFLCYQPQVDLIDEKLVAVEALVRWNHVKKGLLLPLDFIPLAEETGLIIPISEWILRTACAQNKAWQDQGFPPIRVAVNVSAQQFKQHNLIETIKSILIDTGLKPEYLELELTENVILSNSDVINTVTQLKKIGVIVAIDDFGTGYSSLSYLHKIPLDRLKIDGSFIQHIQSDTDDEVIIRAVIAMAKNLNLEVLAEGVETLDQLNFLKKYQCGDVQGFYFSKPLTSSELEGYFVNPSGIKNLINTIPRKK
jgi:diguanylate cyclase (GGDEF)-like protein/PAS domain S-box-containing protein